MANAFAILVTTLMLSVIRSKVSGRSANYTAEEKRALESNRITMSELRRYHGDITWGSYSILLISLFCVLVSIVYSDLKLTNAEDTLILKFAAFELGAAGTILVFADLMHMNGNSPIVGGADRHRIVNAGIWAGVGSVFLLLCGMQTFSLLLSKEIMFALCAVEAVSIYVFVWVRAVEPSA